MALSGALLAPAGYAQVSCTRESLKAVADKYVAAQGKGSTTDLPMVPAMGYVENYKPMALADSILMKPMKIDHTMHLLDTASCQTFTEVIVTDKAAPYVLGVRLRVNRDQIAEIETIWTTTGYWLFNADDYFKYASLENWGPIPAAKRDSRATILAAGNAYLNAFVDGNGDLVPWGYPCQRVEGGAYTGKGKDTDTCQSGLPPGVNIANRHWVIDEELGTVVFFCTFGAGNATTSGSADTHMFRVESGKLRYVHTLTHLLQSSFQGQGKGKGGAPPPGGAPKGKGAHKH
jgi:hypothetical protein